MTENEKVDLGKLRHELNGLRQDFRNFEILRNGKDKLNEENAKKLDRVLTLFLGDESQPHTGILHRVEKIEDFIKYLEKTKNKLTGSIAMAIFIISALGFIAGVLVKAYELLFKK
jgi:hypothetical protein